jgi:hypothetical protein
MAKKMTLKKTNKNRSKVLREPKKLEPTKPLMVRAGGDKLKY